MRHLYVLGGAQRSAVKDTQADWLLFQKALIARVDTETGAGYIEVEYDTPAEWRAGGNSSVLFKSGMIAAGRLYACTSTEVLIYQLPAFRPVVSISLPFFNDLHHVAPTPRGTLAVVVTGLDMVAEITLEGKVIQCWSALGEEPWARFSRAVDYRKIPTLKPYRAHPNFVFWAQGEMWVSRGDLGDAVCLTAAREPIKLGTRECIHDGWTADGRIYFTAVDGHLIVVDEGRLAVEESIDLNANGGASGYSWCRGVLPVDERRAWIGFTRLRPTQWKRKVGWVKHVVSGFPRPTCLALYDLVDKRLLREIDLEPLGMNAVFNALPAEAAGEMAKAA